MKKYIMAVILIVLLSLILSSFIFKVEAVDIDQMGDPSQYIQDNNDNSDIIDIGNVIVWIVRTVGQAVSILILAIIGIKYIMGSVEEKAEYKQTMWPYLLGAVLIFAGASLTDMIYQIFNS